VNGFLKTTVEEDRCRGRDIRYFVTVLFGGWPCYFFLFYMAAGWGSGGAFGISVASIAISVFGSMAWFI
jgi:Zn-dependent protease with chaperone function